MYEIRLVPVELETPALLEKLAATLQSVLQCNIVVARPRYSLHSFLAQDRGQFNAIEILKSVEQRQGPYQILYTSVDLFIPIFTFVFGLAKIGGRAAIISTHRLESRFYGLPENTDLLEERLHKETLHEFGHLLGLRHCANVQCVMAGSTSADELDVKSSEYCPQCRKIIKAVG